VAVTSTPAARLPLKTFLDDLADRLDALPPEDLVRVLLAHAERLPVDARREFLEIFPTPADGSTRTTAEPYVTLMDDIAAFVERLDEGTYDTEDQERYDSFGGWNDEEAAPSWVPDVEALFTAIGEVYLAGRLGLARDAYTRLLAQFGAAGEYGTAPLETGHLERVDVDEVLARYLRTVYETSPGAERAAAMHTAYSGLPWSPSSPLIEDVASAGRTGLPDLDHFLPAWIDVLLADREHPGTTLRTRLLIEAALRHSGADRLAAVARTHGPHQPAVHLAWIDALSSDQRLADAADAAREGLDLSADPAPLAEIADRLADIEARRGRPAEAVSARARAWRTRPTRRRLLALVHAAETAGTLTDVLAAEADIVKNTRRTDRLGCEILLLAGHLDTATAILGAAPALGWSRADHPAQVVLPTLWVAATATTPPPADHGHLGRAFAAIDVDLGAHDPFSTVAPPTADPGTPAAGVADDAPALTALLSRSLLAGTARPADRERWLTIAATVTENRVQAVVTGKRRRSYGSAAGLVVAHAETLATVHRPRDGLEYVARLRAAFPRHVAYRRELDAALRTSALPR